MMKTVKAASVGAQRPLMVSFCFSSAGSLWTCRQNHITICQLKHLKGFRFLSQNTSTSGPAGEMSLFSFSSAVKQEKFSSFQLQTLR